MTSTASELTTSIAELADLDHRQRMADRLLGAEGAGHIVHDLPVRADGRSVSLESRPWRIDPVPFAIDHAEFAGLAAGVAARMRMLEAILQDLYGARSLIADRVIDPAALWASSRYRVAALLPDRPRRWLTTYAVEVIQSEAGDWHVVRDRTDAPSGLGYALLDRHVIAQVHRDVFARLAPGVTPRSLDPFADQLLDALADVTKSESPRIMMMSGGVEHQSFVEQSYLATRLGLNLAEGADLVVRQRRLWLRSLAGLEPVDVLFRRLEDDRLDPMEVNAAGAAGIPGVLLAARSGGVQLANAHGCGVIEDPALEGCWEEAGAWLAHRYVGHDGDGGLHTLRTSGPWRRVPCYDGRRVVERAAVLRLQAVASDLGVEVLTGGTVRVLADGDDPFLPTAATAKDLWVVGGSFAPVVARRAPLPQVDLIASVPTRAAEALFWAGRAAERSELIARAMRVVLDRTGQIDADGWVAPALAMLTRIAGRPAPAGAEPQTVVRLAGEALVARLGSLLAEVSSVREFFSVTAGRVLARLAAARTTLARALADDQPFVDITLVDGVLIDLASFVGLWNESVVHGPAWRFGEVGRRLERVFGLIDGIRGVSGPARGLAEDPFASRRVVELLLATNESLVAYRRRYRSDVDVRTALRLLLASERNPRAAAAALGRLAAEAEELGWELGQAEAGRWVRVLVESDLSSLPAAEPLLADLWDTCALIGRDLVTSRLASPVDPRRMGGS